MVTWPGTSDKNVYLYKKYLLSLNLLFPLAIHFHQFPRWLKYSSHWPFLFPSCSSVPACYSIWPFFFHKLLKWLNLLFNWPFFFDKLLKWPSVLFHLAFLFTQVAQVTQRAVPFVHSFFTHWSIYCPIGHSFHNQLFNWLNILFPISNSFSPITQLSNKFLFNWGLTHQLEIVLLLWKLIILYTCQMILFV